MWVARPSEPVDLCWDWTISLAPPPQGSSDKADHTRGTRTHTARTRKGEEARLEILDREGHGGPQGITTWDQQLQWPWLCFWFSQNFMIHLPWVDHINTWSRVPVFVFLPWVHFVSKNWWTRCHVASLAPSVSKIRGYKTWDSLLRKSDWLLINQWHEKSVGSHQIPIFLIRS